MSEHDEIFVWEDITRSPACAYEEDHTPAFEKNLVRFILATTKREASEEMYEALKAAVTDIHSKTAYRPEWLVRAEDVLKRAEGKDHE